MSAKSKKNKSNPSVQEVEGGGGKKIESVKSGVLKSYPSSDNISGNNDDDYEDIVYSKGNNETEVEERTTAIEAILSQTTMSQSRMTEVLDKLLVNGTELERETIIGNGAFGEVSKGRYPASELFEHPQGQPHGIFELHA